jgi:hypothetical protein
MCHASTGGQAKHKKQEPRTKQKQESAISGNPLPELWLPDTTNPKRRSLAQLITVVTIAKLVTFMARKIPKGLAGLSTKIPLSRSGDIPYDSAIG